MSYRDFTAHKVAQPVELETAAQIRMVLEAVPDAVVIVDRNWKFSYANQRALKLVNNDHIVGHDIFELFPGNLEEPFHSAYRTAMEQRVEVSFEAYHTAPLELWFNVRARPYDDGIIIFFSDVSSRKRAELREQEMTWRLAEVLEATSDAIAALDREWRFTFLNRNASRLIDPGNRLIGLNIWDEFPLLLGTETWKIYQRTMDEGITGNTELFYPEPINAWFAVQTQPSPEGIVLFFREITAQKEHDALIRRQEDLLSVVQKASRLATWELDPMSGTIEYGPGSFEVLGHPFESVSTMDKLSEKLLPGYAESVREAVQRAIQTASFVMIEFAIRAADGSTVWIESRGQVISGPDGLPRIGGMSIDVTSRKLNEQDLIASEERYRVLADLNPQAIWMGDADGNISYANQRFLNFLGFTHGSLNGAGWLEAFAPGDRQRVLDVWTHSVKTGVDYDVEALLLEAASSTYRYHHLRAAPVRDSNGTILHWLGVAQDVHDQKTYAASLRAEQAETERRRAELETLYATTPVGLALLDPVEFRFLNLNDREAEMLGYPKDQILGKLLTEIAPPEGIPELLDMFRSVAAGKVIKDRLLEGELAARPGEMRAWSVNYSPVYNEDGTIRAISTASIEITNQKKAEAALIQSEKLAAVGRLASSISHEINNPLEAITNLLYLIAFDSSLPEQLKIYVHMAQSELSRVSQIATQTLRFHRQAVNRTFVTPAELVGAVVRLYTGRLANSNIRADARYATNTQILCFENDIRQVLNNLIANAIDAMRTGGRLVIRAHDANDYKAAGVPRRGVRITIADTGHGMSESVMRRIFEPFYTTKDLQGTGLGLWISAGIVERHQGRLTVRSSENPLHHGTVFTLFLPCEEKFDA